MNAEPVAITQPTCFIVTDTLARIGEKWSMLVVLHLRNGTQRFGQLKRLMPGVSQRMLTMTLRNLERDGLVKRTSFATNLPRVDYELTSLGVSLSVPIVALGVWAQEHEDDVRTARTAYDAPR